MSQEIPCPLGVFQDLAMGWAMGTFASYPYHWYQSRKKAPTKPIVSVIGLDAGRQVRRRAIVRSWQTGKAFGRWTGLFAVFGCFLPMVLGPVSPVISGALAGGLTGGVLAKKRRKGAFTNGFRQGFIILFVLEAVMHFAGSPQIFPMQVLEPQDGLFEERRKQAIAELEEIARRDKPYEFLSPDQIHQMPAYQRRLLGIDEV